MSSEKRTPISEISPSIEALRVKFLSPRASSRIDSILTLSVAEIGMDEVDSSYIFKC